METSEKIKQIKRAFRLYMNGVTSTSMRQKGLNYKINWGVSQMDLRHMAEEYGKDAALATALWTENIRECKILATLIMPAEQLSADEAMEWASKIETTEMAEMVVFNLFQYVIEVDKLSIKLLQSEEMMQHICAYNLVCRLLKRGKECSSDLYTILFEKATADLKSADRQLLHPLVNCLDYVVSLDVTEAKVASRLLKDAGFYAF